tara:strand:- start:377 stop:763 length:387 start_codon:yes stop_codon:yes gene_type:complete
LSGAKQLKYLIKNFSLKSGYGKLISGWIPLVENNSGERAMQKKSLELQMQGYRLTTAEIIYHLPDYPRLLQSYVWQELDLAPQYPILKKFLDFWEDNLDGRLHSVKLASRKVVRPSEFRLANVELTMH